MKTHLKAFAVHLGGRLVKSASRNRTLSKHFAGLAKVAEADGESGEGTPAQIFSQLADAHNEAAADDTELATHCAEFVKILDSTRKAMGGFDLDALEPSQVSAVHGDAPPSSLRPVFRAGQREFSLLDKNDRANETISKITSLD